MTGFTDPRLGVRLRELRQARGLSLRALARRVPCSHVHVHDLENGSKAPSPALIIRLDAILGAAGELVTLASCLAGESGPAWHPRQEHFTGADAEALAEALVSQTPTGQTALRLAHEWLVAEPPQVYQVRRGRRIGAELVDQVQQRAQQLRLLDDHVGGRESYEVITAELAATAALLREASYSEQVGQRLLSAVGELAQLAGWVASDAGRHAEAERLYLAGARAGHAGGDLIGAANNWSCLAYQMSNVGDPREAVVLARTAAGPLDARAAGAVRALLLERVAWAHARADEPAAAERALDAVQVAFAAREPAGEPAWVYWLDSGEIEIMAGRCWTELRRPLRAVPLLRRAIGGYGADQARESALYLTWLAEALLQAHEVEEAVSSALRALELAQGAQSARVANRVAVLHRRLRPMRGLPAVEAFEDAYAEAVS